MPDSDQMSRATLMGPWAGLAVWPSSAFFCSACMRVATTQMGLVSSTFPQPARKATARDDARPMSWLLTCHAAATGSPGQHHRACEREACVLARSDVTLRVWIFVELLDAMSDGESDASSYNPNLVEGQAQIAPPVGLPSKLTNQRCEAALR